MKINLNTIEKNPTSLRNKKISLSISTKSTQSCTYLKILQSAKKRNKDQKIRAKRKAPLNKASPDNHVKFMPGSARPSSELVRILQVFGVNWYA